MWLYNKQLFTEDMIGENIGFVYLIENKISGRRYIGKKLFKKTRRKKAKKNQKNRKKIIIASDWESYYGSNKELLNDVEKHGTINFTRTILHLCRAKGTCTYLELKEQILHGALESDLYYNTWIMARVRKEHIK